jgi:hypothetical protein
MNQGRLRLLYALLGVGVVLVVVGLVLILTQSC